MVWVYVKMVTCVLVPKTYCDGIVIGIWNTLLVIPTPTKPFDVDSVVLIKRVLTIYGVPPVEPLRADTVA